MSMTRSTLRYHSACRLRGVNQYTRVPNCRYRSYDSDGNEGILLVEGAGILLEEYSIWHRSPRGDLIFNTYRLRTVSRQHRAAHNQYLSKMKSPIRGATLLEEYTRSLRG
ncbi:hypothetical protein Y032_0033g2653 [Ancylostoma ceylanicum]|uniref:Uncharacterized protein n=2 Tax=Ancylostoma ceylanicum TaxID=53326 RepID=A0A016UND4_9BILA|nr:hypothetical protein Y032_0033g2653 [Ancylostoma ceylanicum]